MRPVVRASVTGCGISPDPLVLPGPVELLLITARVVDGRKLTSDLAHDEPGLLPGAFNQHTCRLNLVPARSSQKAAR